MVTAALAYGDYSSALDRARGLLPDADELTHAKLARRLLEAELEAIKAECRALSGEPLVFPSLVPASSAAANDEPKETPRLSEVLAALVEERSSQGKWTAKTRLERETAGAMIVELLHTPNPFPDHSPCASWWSGGPDGTGCGRCRGVFACARTQGVAERESVEPADGRAGWHGGNCDDLEDRACLGFLRQNGAMLVPQRLVVCSM